MSWNWPQFIVFAIVGALAAHWLVRAIVWRRRFRRVIEMAHNGELELGLATKAQLVEELAHRGWGAIVIAVEPTAAAEVSLNIRVHGMAACCARAVLGEALKQIDGGALDVGTEHFHGGDED